MLYSEIIAVCSEIRTKHGNGEEANFWTVILVLHITTTKLKGKLVTAEQDAQHKKFRII
jgi:hypothetical protein